MHLQTHLMLSWLVGHRLRERRDRAIVAWSGVAPDLDGLTLLGGIDAYQKWHHVISHGLPSAVIVAVAAGAMARQRLRTALLAFAVFHLHLVCDLLGSGTDWPILYLWPFSAHETYTPYGWPLGSWQNFAITAAALVAVALVAKRSRRTFAEAFLPERIDAKIVEVLHRPVSAPREDAVPTAPETEP